MKKTLSLILAVMMLLGCMSVTAFAAASGTGTKNDPYLFSTLEVNDIIIATDYVKNDTEEILDYEIRYIDRETQETERWRPQPDPGQTMQFTFDEYSNDTQFIYKGFDEETALWGGAYVFEQITPEGEEGKSGNTDITLTVAKALTYDMVIPEDVTNLSNFGIYSVGQAKVQNVKNATDNTVISYTAETTAFKCEGKTDIPASYYTDEAGQNTFPTTAVKVYENKKDAENIHTMYVGISETDWNAAENGTYTATVTFNFSAEEVEKVTIADILPEEFPESSSDSWWRGGTACALYATGGNLCAKGDYTVSVPVTTVLAPASGDYDYTCTVDGITWKFAMSGDEFCKVNISGAQGDRWEVNGDYSEVD